jgi:RNAse (barnase) inhibitor barstar
MMAMESDWQTLLSLSPPWAHLASCTERTFDKFFIILSHTDIESVTRVLRGTHSQTSADFFREAEVRLQFPNYFGHNWDAFNDCINDLEWLPTEHYVFGISQSDLLLAKDETWLATFACILSDAADAWSIDDPDRDWTKTWVTATDGTTEWAQRPVASFHVVFHCEPEKETATRDRFQKAGLSLASLPIPPEFAAQ